LPLTGASGSPGRDTSLADPTWSGYIQADTIDTWHVRLAADVKQTSERVILDVLSGPAGTPVAMLAEGMRIVIRRDGLLSRSPTPGEYAFLADLVRERRYNNGFPVR
jgi:hypothetical protein